MSMKRRILGILAAALAFLLGPAGLLHAQQIVADVSRKIVELRYDFAGTELLLFGAVKGPVSALEQLDIVVVLAGPDEPMIVRRKAKVAGLIWVNSEEARIRSAPGFYALTTTQPLAAIAEDETLARLKLGPAHLPLEIEGPLAEEQLRDFREGFFRRMQAAGLYRLQPDGVRLAEETLFRTTVDLPANVPAGDFKAQIYLFADGRLIDRRRLAIDVDKTGFERGLFAFAHGYPFLYGLSAVVIALLAGWAAGLASRR